MSRKQKGASFLHEIHKKSLIFLCSIVWKGSLCYNIHRLNLQDNQKKVEKGGVYL